LRSAQRFAPIALALSTGASAPLLARGCEPPPTPPSPVAGHARPATPSGASFPDISHWAWWWNFNRDPYSDIKRHVFKGGVLAGSDGFFLGHGQIARKTGEAPSLDGGLSQSHQPLRHDRDPRPSTCK